MGLVQGLVYGLVSFGSVQGLVWGLVHGLVQFSSVQGLVSGLVVFSFRFSKGFSSELSSRFSLRF